MSISDSFSPIARSPRHDGWSPDKQRAFIEALADCGVVSAAAEKVGMGRASAYRLRDEDGADEFVEAWDRALSIGMSRLQDIAVERAINGTPIPHFYKGEQVGESRFYDNKLLTFLLGHANTRRFSRHTAEYDRIEEVERIKQDRDNRRLELIERAETMLEAINDMIDMHIEDTIDPAADGAREAAQALDELYAKRNKLEEALSNLQLVDQLKMEEERINSLQESGRFSEYTARRFRKRIEKRRRESGW